MDEINHTLTACFCAAAAVGCGFLFVADLISRIRVERTEGEESGELVRRIPLLFRLFIPFAGNISPLLTGSGFDNSRKKAGESLLMAGYDQAISADRFVAVRVLMAGTGTVLMGIGVAVGQPLAGLLVLALLLAHPWLWLRGIVKKRHLSIQKSLPNVLDLLTLSVEAGKDLLTAMRDIIGRRRGDAIGEELGRALREIQVGKARRDALRDLSDRVRQPDLTSVINAMIQAEEMGVSIGQLLRIQSDQLRVKRFQRAEKLANEAPVKILMPVVLFIFPAVIIILMAPILMQAFKSLAT